MARTNEPALISRRLSAASLVFVPAFGGLLLYPHKLELPSILPLSADDQWVFCLTAIFAVLLSGGVGVALVHLGTLRWRPLGFSKYRTVLLAAFAFLLTILAPCVLPVSIAPYPPAVVLWALGCLLIGLLLALCIFDPQPIKRLLRQKIAPLVAWFKIFLAPKPIKALPAEQKPSEVDDAEFFDWLRTEAPASRDYFDTTPIAEKIAELLTLGTDQRRDVSIALIGSFGSGKSTVLNMVESKLLSADPKLEDRLIIRRLSLWDALDRASACQRIVDMLLDAAAEGTDITSLASVPASYRAALTAAPGWFGVFASLLHSIQNEPISYLTQINDLLRASNCRIILFIEDVERSNVRKLATDIHGLLDQLRELDQISFVHAFVPEQTYDARIYDCILSMPSISLLDVWKIISKVRTRCLAGSPSLWINPIAPQDQMFGPSSIDPHLPEHSWMFDPEDDLRAALSHQVKTPRTLKRVLQDVERAWYGPGMVHSDGTVADSKFSLRGELDFDHLLTAITLRRMGKSNLESWITQDPSTGRTSNYEVGRDSANRAKDMLLKRILGKEEQPETFSPQGLGSLGYKVYRQRFNLERIREGVRDQEVLRLLHDWNDSTVTESESERRFIRLVDRLSDTAFWEVFIRLLRHRLAPSVAITEQQFLHLASAVIDRSEQTISSGGRQMPQPFNSLASINISMLRENPNDVEAATEWLRTTISKLIATDLFKAHRFWWLWYAPERRIYYGNNSFTPIHRHLQQQLASRLEDPHRFAEIIDSPGKFNVASFLVPEKPPQTIQFLPALVARLVDASIAVPDKWLSCVLYAFHKAIDDERKQQPTAPFNSLAVPVPQLVTDFVAAIPQDKVLTFDEALRHYSVPADADDGIWPNPDDCRAAFRQALHVRMHAG